jgi:uncharacterized protein YcbX
MFLVSDIIIYPIKSLGKVSLRQSQANIKGFQYDRRMMLTDDKGHFLSQRKHPEMARFKVSMADDSIMVIHDGEEISIPFKMKLKKSRSVTIWDDQFIAPEADKHIGVWFSEHLNIKCHLIFMDDNTLRAVDKKYAIHNETVSFSDGFPFLIIGSASLDDLNNRLAAPVSMDRFRPNLVIKTDKPFIEDSLDIFKIGDAVFKRAKPCARCIITTTDQLTAKRYKEPLKTLSSYRKENNKIYFGQNLICLQEGLVRIGDKSEPILNYFSL